MTPHPFFRSFLNYFGVQLHHLPTNAMVYLSTFVSLCENYIGCPPHWAFFKHIFSCRSQTIKKTSPTNGKTKVIQLCGGLGIQVKSSGTFPAIRFPETIKLWQNTWFYCKDIPTSGSQTGLPIYTGERFETLKSLRVSKDEKVDVDILVEALVGVKRAGVDDIDLLEVFISHRIQPLQEKLRPMYTYDGLSDSTRVSSKAITVAKIEARVKRITAERDDVRGSGKVPPFDRAHLPPEVTLPFCNSEVLIVLFDQGYLF